MKAQWWMGAVLGLAMVSTGGCEFLQTQGIPVGDEIPYNPMDTSGDVAVKRDAQFTDIPVPLGFRLRRNDSYSFQGNSFRFGTFRYEGAWTLRNTWSFYEDQMVVSGWTHQETQEFDPQRHMRLLFEKDGERCEIDIRSEENVEVIVHVFKERADDQILSQK